MVSGDSLHVIYGALDRSCPEEVDVKNAFMTKYRWEVKQMNLLKQLNAAIEYIEADLCAEPDLDTAAGIACATADCFLRFFSYTCERINLPVRNCEEINLHF